MSIESYNNYLTEESALDLRVEANTILAQDPEEKLTWWYELSKSPSNIIENFILRSAHQHGLDGYLGAEWWIRSHDTIDSQWYFHVDQRSEIESELIKENPVIARNIYRFRG